MREYNQPDSGSGLTVHALMNIVRLAATGLGIVVIIMGLVYATRIFHVIYTTLQSPETFHSLLDQWVIVLGGEELDLTIAGGTFHGAHVFSVLVLGGGAAILAWIAIGLILAGAKIVSWTTDESETIKRILRHTYGSERKVQAPSTREDDKEA